MDDVATFGRLLRRLRKARGLTQEALARQAAYAVDTVKKLEQGLRRPSQQLAAQLADCLALHGGEREHFLAAAHPAPLPHSGEATSALPSALSAEIRHNLPAATTPLVGREGELEVLRRLLGDPAARLVTILAPGGMGKTSLAVAVARTLLGQYADGVFVVSLAPLATGSSPVAHIAEAVRLPIQPDGRPLIQQLLSYLRAKQMLLVLDNVEQLLPECGDVLNELLQQCGELRLLVTSRERLQLSSETVFALHSLAFPSWETPPDVGEYAAVQLFAQMAQRVRPDFRLTSDNLQFVARICRLVEGMPLGIILAANWLAVLSAEEIAAELMRGFDFLQAELRDLADRHRTMRAVLASSWRRLAKVDRTGFARLSVFHGGFTRRAAEQVTEITLPSLTRLVHSSFVYPVADRYEMHELLRQYGEEQLQSTGELEQLRDAHSRFFLELVSQRADALASDTQFTVLAELWAEFENIRIAWTWAVQRHDYHTVDRALDGFWRWFWLARGRQQEGLTLLRQALASWTPTSGQPAPRVWSRLAARLTELEGPWLKADPDAFARLGAALEQARQQGDLAESAFCAWGLGFVILSQRHGIGPAESLEPAVEYFTQSLVYYRAHDDSFWVAQVLENLGHCHRAMHRYAQAVIVLRESLERRRRTGDRFGMARCARELGFAAYLQGLTAETEVAWGEAYSLYSALGDTYGTMDSLFFLGVFELTRGNWQSAKSMITQVAAIADGMYSELYHRWSARALEIVAAIADTEGSAMDIGYPFSVGHSAFTARFVFLLFGASRSKQLPLSLAEAASDEELATCLPFAAHLLAQEGDLHTAVQLLAVAYRYAQVAEGWIPRLPEIVGLPNTLMGALGPSTFQNLWEAGKAQEIQSVVASARTALKNLSPQLSTTTIV